MTLPFEAYFTDSFAGVVQGWVDVPVTLHVLQVIISLF